MRRLLLLLLIAALLIIPLLAHESSTPKSINNFNKIIMAQDVQILQKMIVRELFLRCGYNQFCIWGLSQQWRF